MLIETDTLSGGIPSEKPKEMLSLTRTPDGSLRVRINFSSLSLMQECWRKVEYSLIRKLKSNLESPATLFGSAIHKGLEVYYSSPRTSRNLPKGYQEIMQMIGAGTWDESWREETIFRATWAFVEKGKPLSALGPDSKNSIPVGIWMLSHYFRTYVTDPFVVLEDEKGPLVERQVSMVIHEETGLEIELFGTIDCVLQNEATGIKLPTDHKTASQLGTQFYNRLSPNFQYTAYLWMAREVLGIDTDTFLVNALGKPDKGLPKTPAIVARGPNFARQPTTRTQEDFDELRLAIIAYVRSYLRNLERSEWPMHAPGPCSNYGGCQYLEVCSAPRQLRETVIAAKYAGAGS